jgi:mRNA interferase RelE/StbE
VAYRLRYHPDIRDKDLPLINKKIKDRLKNAIETRLSTTPHEYGEPLRKTLKGYWKLRVGDYRIVYKVVENEIWILGIIHRKKVYEEVEKRK